MKITRKIKKFNKRGPNLTDLEISQIIYLYENNITLTEISRYFKKDNSTIFRILQKYKY